jgi:hypothetical protein
VISLCDLFSRRHNAVKVVTAAGTAWRCSRCGAPASTSIELLDPDDDGYVQTDRTDQYDRLVGERFSE